jgi:hypothetical protein
MTSDSDGRGNAPVELYTHSPDTTQQPGGVFLASEPQDQKVDYESGLRVIGRHLDAEPSYNVSILEVDDGFTLRYQPTQHRFDGRTVHFGATKLRDLSIFQTAGRGCAKRHHRHEGMSLKFAEGHEEFLRAVGFMLDREAASSLTLDELADEVRVTYVRATPENTMRTEKRDLAFGESDIQAMVDGARQRRQGEPRALHG